MNIYQSLNQMIQYIEEHLEQEISLQELARILGTNEYTMQKLFSLLCNISLADYIRKRRLSCAGSDLFQSKEKLIDIALKYQYENPTSFSRAFEKFHGMKPSQVKDAPERLQFYAKLVFNENVSLPQNIEYHIEKKEAFSLYGIGMKTSQSSIGSDAPRYFQEMRKKYANRYGEFDYGMTVYENRFYSDQLEYWVLYNKSTPGFTHYTIPESYWIVFHIPSENPKDIQETTAQFYLSFAPSSGYVFRNLPELEYYHDSVTEFMIPIEEPKK